MKELPSSPPATAIIEPVLRAPLVWLLLPLCAGITLAAFYETEPLALALAALGLALVSCLTIRPYHRGWSILFPCAAILAAWAYASARFVLPPVDWDHLPPREVEVELRLERLFPNHGGKLQGGVGRIVKAPTLLPELVGQGVVFRLEPKEGAVMVPGATLFTKGVINRLAQDPPPGSFEAWLERQEVYFELRQGFFTGVSLEPPFWQVAALSTRQWMRENLLAGSDLHGDLRALLPAMLLGERALLSEDQKETFGATGMLHLFAVSGLHVGLIALTFNHILMVLRVSGRGRAIVGLLLLLAYVIIIGATPSAVRAYFMTLFFWGGRAFSRSSSPSASLVASAVAALLWQPRQLFDGGFQLSYGIVAGIFLYGLPLSSHLKARLTLYRGLPQTSRSPWQQLIQQVLYGFGAAISVSVGAFLASVPLSIQFFGVYAPGGMLLNLLMSPLALLCVVAGTLSLAIRALALIPVLSIFSYLADFLNISAWTCGLVMQSVIEAFLQRTPFFHRVAADAPWQGFALLGGMLTLMVLLRSRGIRHRTSYFLIPPVTLLLAVAVLRIEF